MLDLVSRVRNRTNPNLSYRIMVTMYDRRNRVHRSILEQMKAAFGSALLETTIEVDTKLRESQVFGQPITLYAPNSRAAVLRSSGRNQRPRTTVQSGNVAHRIEVRPEGRLCSAQ